MLTNTMHRQPLLDVFSQHQLTDGEPGQPTALWSSRARYNKFLLEICFVSIYSIFALCLVWRTIHWQIFDGCAFPVPEHLMSPFCCVAQFFAWVICQFFSRLQCWLQVPSLFLSQLTSIICCSPEFVKYWLKIHSASPTYNLASKVQRFCFKPVTGLANKCKQVKIVWETDLKTDEIVNGSSSEIQSTLISSKDIFCPGD